MSIHDKTFRSGDTVLANGMYEIFHVEHPLAGQVALFKGEQFPKCSRCDFPVTFMLQREVPALDYIDNVMVRVPLTELEPIQPDDGAPRPV